MRELLRRATKKLFSLAGLSIVKSGQKPRIVINTYLALLSKRNGSLAVVQVGANDGVTNDPIYHGVLNYASDLLLIEPQKTLIQSLEAAYASFTGNLHIRQLAIDTEDRTLELFGLSERAATLYKQRSGLNPTAIASIRKEHVVKQLAKILQWTEQQAAAEVEAFQVRSRPLQQVITECSFPSVDLLQVDVEGFDWQVINSLGSIRPFMINYERRHLSEKDRRDCDQWMMQNNYGWVSNGPDCFAVQGYRNES